MKTTRSKDIRLLRDVFVHGGFVRVKMDHRRNGYRSGWELRLPTRADVGRGPIRAALRRLQFESGSAYQKSNQWIIPIYGREQIERFLKIVKPPRKDTIPCFPDHEDMRFKAQDEAR